jgi:hypothetical protein
MAYLLLLILIGVKPDRNFFLEELKKVAWLCTEGTAHTKALN